jgi:hypothetical protein
VCIRACGGLQCKRGGLWRRQRRPAGGNTSAGGWSSRPREIGRRRECGSPAGGERGRPSGGASAAVRPAASAGDRPATRAAVRRREHGGTAGDKREKPNCCASVGHWRAAGQASVDRQVERRAADGRPAGGRCCRQLAMDAID